jgi:phage-related protein
MPLRGESACLYVKHDIEYERMSPYDKPLVWLSGEIRTPPLSKQARVEAGFLLRLLQKGEVLCLPRSRPMPSVGRGCHELRINDKNLNWRIIYRTDPDAVAILEVFEKKTRATPQRVIDACKRRLHAYDNA